MVQVMTDPSVCSFTCIEDLWSVESLLRRIAEAKPPMHALIDTGALITGLSNIEVARRILDLGLAWCEGVVYLDEHDRKMILLRATGRVVWHSHYLTRVW